MPEDLDDHRRIFDACPERVEGAAMIFKLPQLGQCSTGHSFSGRPTTSRNSSDAMSSP
jgi:hypothetical protein